MRIPNDIIVHYEERADGTGIEEHYVGELIRCKECKWYKTNYTWNCREVKVCVIEPYEPIRKDDDYCSCGERKDNG